MWRPVVAALMLTSCGERDAVRPEPPEPPPPPVSAPVAQLAIVPSKPRIDAGETFQLGVRATDAQQRPVAATNVMWTTSSPEIAAVSGSGAVSGVSPGYVRISATALGAGASTMMHVQRDGVYPDLVVIEPATSAITVCDALELHARTVPDVGSARFLWRSADSTVARVDANGTVQGRTAGTVAITALWLPDTSRRAIRQLSVTPC